MSIKKVKATRITRVDPIKLRFNKEEENEKVFKNRNNQFYSKDNNKIDLNHQMENDPLVESDNTNVNNYQMNVVKNNYKIHGSNKENKDNNHPIIPRQFFKRHEKNNKLSSPINNNRKASPISNRFNSPINNRKAYQKKSTNDMNNPPDNFNNSKISFDNFDEKNNIICVNDLTESFLTNQKKTI